MPFTIPVLKYSYDSLEPAVDAKTMEIHHSKHHAGYVTKLNEALKDTEYAEWDLVKLMTELENLPAELQTSVRNNGGGHANHSLFWEILTPGGASAPEGELLSELNNQFGDLAEFESKLIATGLAQFGSGWTWLVQDFATRGLEIISTANQDSPYLQNKKPLLGIDVWEHAYYLKYQNLRADYLNVVVKLINWDIVSANYAG